MEDTIAAISTSLGVGAISIIRVSGSKSLEIVNKIFNKNILNYKTHTIHYGYIVDNDKIIDEVLLNIMLAPKTYTKETIVEINCHGGISSTNKVLELLLNNGCRLAEPGEFTKRAFLNGRIDLTQAEGIMNLIESKTDTARNLSIKQLNGEVSNLIASLRNDLINIISNIEVNIDYPEYEDIEVLTNQKILPSIKKIQEKIKDTINKSNNGKLINEGINIGIIGKPNVGKSSLLNYLLEEEKAIVTDIAGTTRDIVEGKFILNGIICNIIDTAGIRETDNIVEKIGVEKSKSIISSADLIIYILDNSTEITKEELEILNQIKNKNYILVVNKIDLEKKLILDEEYIQMSIKENIGIDLLKKKIIEIYNLEKIETEDMTYLSSARSISLLKQSLEKINDSIQNINNGFPIDIIELDLKASWEILGEIIGETYKEELIDEMFKRFCLGK